MRYKVDPSFKHPLTDFVLKAFEDANVHDSSTLAVRLAGCSTLKVPRSKKDGIQAYELVAQDVLGVMLATGHLVQTESGWFKLAKSDDSINTRSDC